MIYVTSTPPHYNIACGDGALEGLSREEKDRVAKNLAAAAWQRGDESYVITAACVRGEVDQ